MKKYDNNAYVLTYSEYVAKATELKKEGWAGFRIYPDRPGVIYVWAFNPGLEAHRILTLGEYVKLRDSGMWARGVDRLKEAPATRVPSTNKASDTIKLNRMYDELTAAEHDSVNFEQLQKSVRKILDKYR